MYTWFYFEVSLSGRRQIFQHDSKVSAPVSRIDNEETSQNFISLRKGYNEKEI